jgi:hypothetical protein
MLIHLKVILASIFLLGSFDYKIECKEEYNIVLIMDDCYNWSAVPNNALKYKSDFIYSKNLPKNQLVSLGHIWFDPKPKPATQTISYSEIIKMEPNYTSEMNFEDWSELKSRKDSSMVFILKPEDFCSEKRFSFNHQFTLYEVKFRITEYE